MRIPLSICALALACGMVICRTAAATTIGLNFVGAKDDATDVLSLSQSAGVVPQTSWNSLTGSNTNNTADAVTIVDSSGAATSVSVSWMNGAANYDDISTSGGSTAGNADQALNNGGIWGATARLGGPSVTVSNIPFASYDVIVTSLLDHSGTIISTTLGGTTYYADQTQNYNDPGYIDGTSPTFTYTQSTDTTGAGTPLGDYALFTGLTGSSFTVSEDVAAGQPATAANLSSIEIVPVAAVPEPGSLLLFACGAIVLLIARTPRKVVGKLRLGQWPRATCRRRGPCACIAGHRKA